MRSGSTSSVRLGTPAVSGLAQPPLSRRTSGTWSSHQAALEEAPPPWSLGRGQAVLAFEGMGRRVLGEDVGVGPHRTGPRRWATRRYPEVRWVVRLLLSRCPSREEPPPPRKPEDGDGSPGGLAWKTSHVAACTHPTCRTQAEPLPLRYSCRECCEHLAEVAKWLKANPTRRRF
jgi:hypothetical protein